MEIGSHWGRSTVLLASAAPPSVHVVAVDPFDDPRWGGGPESLLRFNENMKRAGVDTRVKALRVVSSDAAAQWSEGRVGLLFVDGSHDVASVLTDIDAWRPYLSPSARVYFHDAFSSIGVTEALFRRLFTSSDYRYVGSVRSLAMFERAKLHGSAKILNQLRLLRRTWWFGKNIAIKIAITRGWLTSQYPF